MDNRESALRALRQTDLGMVIRSIRSARDLPKPDFHFAKHGPALGVDNVAEYLARLRHHLQRPDLTFYVLQRKQGDLMWYAVHLDSGEVAQYNQHRRSLWSYYRVRNVLRLLASDALIRIVRVGERWEIET